MTGLTPAHRGYEYQDLLVACRLVDVLLETLTDARVDEKLVTGDRFDDLTVRDVSGRWERTQFKHSSGQGKPLGINAFTKDDRGLRLDRLVAAAIAFRDSVSAGSPVQMRIVMRDAPPTEPALANALAPATSGPFIEGMATSRWTFDANKLWPDDPSVHSATAEAFEFLRVGPSRVARGDLAWLCDRLELELEAPAMSADLTAPGPAEHLLLDRVRRELGAGLFPNEHRSAVDVAEALVRAARSARQGEPATSRTELLRRTQLREDHGTVNRAHPVQTELAVPRPAAVEDLLAAVRRAAINGGAVLATGSPGQGKSWVCKQLVDRLIDEQWVVAEHYCYLDDADGDRMARVMAESVFGSLIHRIADADPAAVSQQRPRFAVDERALIDAITAALQRAPGRRVALVIDGLDHITRVRAGLGHLQALDPSFSLAEALSALPLPASCALVVLSQPGHHLRPLEDKGAESIGVPSLTDSELGQLAARIGMIPYPEFAPHAQPTLLEADQADAFVAALAQRSAGNALYATYLCRELLIRPSVAADAAATIMALPPFDGTLQGYYDHLYSSLEDGGAWVADVLALLDMPVTREELREIVPDRAHRVDRALEILAPVLVDRVGHNAIRIYHESFARYLRLPFQNEPGALRALLDRVAGWLDSKGLFRDARSFACLLRVLADAGRENEVVDRVGRDFVKQALAAGHTASAIRANLATAVRCAAHTADWATLVRCVELSRSAETFQHERYDSTLIDYADVPIALLGAQVLSDRLLHDERTVMPGRAGLQMCAAIDRAGAVAPWRKYLAAHKREAEDDNTSYGHESDLQVNLATLLGRLRLSASAGALPPADVALDRLASTPPAYLDGDEGDDHAGPVSLRAVADLLDDEFTYDVASSVVDALSDTHGEWTIPLVVWHQDSPGVTCLTLAQQVVDGSISSTNGSARTWAVAAAAHGVPVGSAHHLIALGVEPDDITFRDVAASRRHLIDLTKEVQEDRSPDLRNEVAAWRDAVAIAAVRDRSSLDTAEALITGEGWYRCWLRFVLALARSEQTDPSQISANVLAALRLLTGERNPFVGKPRACDLYEIDGQILETAQQAVLLLDDTHWEAGIRVLLEVSASIATSLRGELGGPLAIDEILKIAVATANPARYDAAREFVRQELKTGAGGRFYSDLASYQLLGARLALAAGDKYEAEMLWLDAARFLTAYGWHKDITVHELLEPLPTLIAADPARGRAATAALQPLCDRIRLHTDGKETEAAWREWWNVIAQADPVSLAYLITPVLLADCNMPHDLLHDARENLWRHWHHAADPVAAAALRLTLDNPLLQADPAVAARLATIADEPAADLLRWILCRADERSFAYTYANSDDYIAADNARLAELNRIADEARAPRVQSRYVLLDEAEVTNAYRSGSRLHVDIGKQLERDMLPVLATEEFLLSDVIRAWFALPNDERGSQRHRDRFANLIGYRLIELAEGDRVPEVAAVLRMLCGPTIYPDEARLLDHLAQGLARHGHRDLAAQAYALCWTRSRGGGGWLSFGGSNALDALRAASDLDEAVTTSVVAEEVERMVAASRYGTHGITQALIIAFATKAMSLAQSDAVETAFALWNEAYAVISDRAPRVDDSDDPDQPYATPSPDDGSRAPGDLDTAFAVAALAGLAQAGREDKRRALLATRTLLMLRPDTVGPAVAIALSTLSDPATLTWLLCMLEQLQPSCSSVIELCAPHLRVLAQGPNLTIRAIARRLLPHGSDEIPLGPSEASALTNSSSELWVPEGEHETPDSTAAKAVVRDTAGSRLAHASALLPGIASAVVDRVIRNSQNLELQRRMRVQWDRYSDQMEEREPDAYLAIEQCVEESLQQVAAGARAFRMTAGRPVSDPIAFEERLADTLADDPNIPLELEATRHPRPLFPPTPADREVWRLIEDAAQGDMDTTSTLAGARARRSSLAATASIQPATRAPRVEGGSMHGWLVIGTAEQQLCPVDGNRRGNHIARRYTGLEFRNPGSRSALEEAPFAGGDLNEWFEPESDWSAAFSSRGPQPMLGMDFTMEAAGDANAGLGLPTCVLTPKPALVTLLRLRPSGRFMLEDAIGPACSLIIWRTRYERSNYHLPWPRVTGCAVALRPDLLVLLTQRAPAPLAIREFLLGDRRLATAS